MLEYPHLVEDIKDNIYAISKRSSLVDIDTYKLIMRHSGCDFTSAKYDYLNVEVVSGAINTEEKLIRNDLAQNFFKDKLRELGISIQTNYKVVKKELTDKTINDEKFDVVLNCTWGTLKSDLLDRYSIYYEPCIYFYYSSYDESSDFALTVMDGELFSLYPYYKNIYTLTSVKYTPIVKTNSIETAKQVLNDVTDEFAEERRKLFEEQACLYMPEFLEKFKFEKVELSLKTKVKSQTDSRFCIVEHKDGLIDIFSGKIDTLKFAEDSVFSIFGFIRMKVCLIGTSSNIVKELIKSFKGTQEVEFVRVGRSEDLKLDLSSNKEVDLSVIPLDCDFYLISLGILFPKRILEQSEQERLLSLKVNLLAPVMISELLLSKNKKANILIIGSESGEKGSYDTSYFLSKSAVSSYVREKRINYPEQSINILSPSVIMDTKMTQEREDLDKVNDTVKKLPMERGGSCKDIVSLISFFIKHKNIYISNQNIGINGGKFARMHWL